jgi:hypothetical protein
VVQLVEAEIYQPGGRGFDSRWGYLVFALKFILPLFKLYIPFCWNINKKQTDRPSKQKIIIHSGERIIALRGFVLVTNQFTSFYLSGRTMALEST